MSTIPQQPRPLHATSGLRHVHPQHLHIAIAAQRGFAAISIDTITIWTRSRRSCTARSPSRSNLAQISPVPAEPRQPLSLSLSPHTWKHNMYMYMYMLHVYSHVMLCCHVVTCMHVGITVPVQAVHLPLCRDRDASSNPHLHTLGASVHASIST